MQNQKVLLVTGELAEELVRKYASGSDVETEVKVLPISIASFMNLKLLLKGMEEIKSDEYSMVLVPGLARFDLHDAEDRIRIPVFKGPKYAADIPPVLDNLGKLELSKEKPACEISKEKMSEWAEKQLKVAEEEAKSGVDKSRNFEIGGNGAKLWGGVDFPPRIVAEISDAPMRSNDELVKIADRYVQDGAEIIDIGMVSEKEMSSEIPRMISTLRERVDVPISVDTHNKEEIETAIEHGIDLIVSINGSTLDEFPSLEVPAVIVPVDPEEGYYPHDPSEKVKYLISLLERAEELGYRRAIGDPILEPVGLGFYDSLVSFYELRKHNSKIPIFMGVGNVIELFDADSVGMSALLMGMANEVGASFVLSVEGSDKTRGNISEISRARDMMTLANYRNSVPKDLGLDLLILKEKRRSFDPYPEDIEQDKVTIQASPKKEFQYDSRGFFKIWVHESEIITAFQGKESNIIIKGKNAEDICQEIVDRGLVSKLSHASYLGRELQKAEIALRTGRAYVQEKDLF
ncbi:hypothetical protein AKJ43_02075 [candidate division MSBL1 archaeon SCGC-AAA261D19]|uniref:Pterin-binding domain-containing protein n=1 Tax=candidate division MSBL1 archaeon SCGC-AAA261D19 TaxID=1698273 RepID=A0A133V774_9EURY|nr:hypothetical protein AKJ43_02075 [candidate division MSBL1 archaeon SCGC-AAA261D19]